eukprot:295936-Chlamydomonas_euryale.AAC.1
MGCGVEDAKQAVHHIMGWGVEDAKQAVHRMAPMEVPVLATVLWLFALGGAELLARGSACTYTWKGPGTGRLGMRRRLRSPSWVRWVYLAIVRVGEDVGARLGGVQRSVNSSEVGKG